jgi:hypothetical protein
MRLTKASMHLQQTANVRDWCDYRPAGMGTTPLMSTAAAPRLNSSAPPRAVWPVVFLGSPLALLFVLLRDPRVDPLIPAPEVHQRRESAPDQGRRGRPRAVAHRALLLVIEAQGADDHGKAYAALRAAALQSSTIADPLGSAIVRQFPDRFGRQTCQAPGNPAQDRAVQDRMNRNPGRCGRRLA